VYKLSIGAACELEWPKDRIIVQVLDDSTDPYIKVDIFSTLYFEQICLHATFVGSCKLPLLIIILEEVEYLNTHLLLDSISN
jgi:hypothetical protein